MTHTSSQLDTETIETDYLIIGSGAVGMAFADVLLTETDARLVIVDRHHRPGGHWNDAYPFVRLHQPSAFYGVSSRELCKGRKDAQGPNEGLYEMASGAEVTAYFDEVMQHDFLPTGRVRYLPMCEYRGQGDVESLVGDRTFKVSYRRAVDATYLKTTVPSTHTPGFEISSGAWFCPLNDLPRIKRVPSGYTVVGGGKTGIDACLWLLDMGVEPDSIRWIMPRDGWLLDRANSQPHDDFFHSSIGALAHQTEALAKATSIDNLFERLEASGVLLRLDPTVKPKMFHGATVSRGELEQLRKIKDVVRMGRVVRLGEHAIEMEDGSLPTSPDHLHVDCSASAVGNLEPTAIFNGDTITPQTVRSYQPVFSAAFVAHVEASYEDEKTKNRICNVVPLPNHDTDWIRGIAATMMNQSIWAQEDGMRDWLLNNRLDGFSQLIRSGKDDPQRRAVLDLMRENMMPAMANIQNFLREISANEENPE